MINPPAIRLGFDLSYPFARHGELFIRARHEIVSAFVWVPPAHCAGRVLRGRREYLARSPKFTVGRNLSSSFGARSGQSERSGRPRHIALMLFDLNVVRFERRSRLPQRNITVFSAPAWHSRSVAHWSVETRRVAVSQSIKCHRASFYAFARSGIRKRPWIMKR